MWRLTGASAAAALLISCANASEPALDGSDPVHCLMIFGVAANGAQQARNAALADAMFQRTMYLAKQNGGVDWINKVKPQAMEIASRMEASPKKDAVVALLDTCVAKQDADPAFRAGFKTR